MIWGPGTYGYKESDLENFFKHFCPTCSTSKVEFDVSNLWNGTDGDNFGEGTLDVQWIASMGNGVRTLVSNTNISASTEKGESFGNALFEFLIMLNSREVDMPLVLSFSLGSMSYRSCDRLCKTINNDYNHT